MFLRLSLFHLICFGLTQHVIPNVQYLLTLKVLYMYQLINLLLFGVLDIGKTLEWWWNQSTSSFPWRACNGKVLGIYDLTSLYLWMWLALLKNDVNFGLWRAHKKCFWSIPMPELHCLCNCHLLALSPAQVLCFMFLFKCPSPKAWWLSWPDSEQYLNLWVLYCAGSRDCICFVNDSKVRCD